MRGRTKAGRILVVALVMGLLPASSSATADLTGNVAIQPGAPMFDPGGYVSTYCTMNFVFKDKARKNPRTYVGASNYCTRGIGSRASAPEIWEFGTVVFESMGAGGFALIRIDKGMLKHVSRVMRGLGSAPSGYTTSGETSAGDVLVTHGYPYGAAHPAAGVTRTGLLGEDTATRYWSSIQPNIQEKGSPVMRVDGKAVGISDELTSFWGVWAPQTPPLARYLTVERILKLLRSAGFNVTL